MKAFLTAVLTIPYTFPALVHLYLRRILCEVASLPSYKFHTLFAWQVPNRPAYRRWYYNATRILCALLARSSYHALYRELRNEYAGYYNGIMALI